jgi:hypothetical protein
VSPQTHWRSFGDAQLPSIVIMRPIAVLAILAASPLLRAQNVGLELHHGGPFVLVAGSACQPVTCAIGPGRVLNVPLGATFSAHVFGAPHQLFLLGVGGPLACQAIPGLQNDLALGGITAVVSGILGPQIGTCTGPLASATLFGITVPASLPAGSQFLFQALTVEPSTMSLAFTSPVLLIAG